MSDQCQNSVLVAADACFLYIDSQLRGKGEMKKKKKDRPRIHVEQAAKEPIHFKEQLNHPLLMLSAD